MVLVIVGPPLAKTVHQIRPKARFVEQTIFGNPNVQMLLYQLDLWRTECAQFGAPNLITGVPNNRIW